MRRAAAEAGHGPRIILFSLALAILLFRPRLALASPATFITALPVSKDQIVARLSALGSSYRDASAGSDNINVARFPVTFLYGATSRWALALQPGAQIGQMTQGGSASGSSGASDTLLFLRYTLLDKDWPRNTFRIAPVAGAYLPTGFNDASGPSGRLPSPLQSGSGSADSLLGLTAAWYNPRYGTSWDATWRHNPPASASFDLGDTARADGQFELRLWPRTLPKDHVPDFIWADFETNLVWNGLTGVPDAANGGFAWLGWAGLEYQSVFWEAGALAGWPLAQNIPNGASSRGMSVLVFAEYYLSMPSWNNFK